MTAATGPPTAAAAAAADPLTDTSASLPPPVEVSSSSSGEEDAPPQFLPPTSGATDEPVAEHEEGAEAPACYDGSKGLLPPPPTLLLDSHGGSSATAAGVTTTAIPSPTRSGPKPRRRKSVKEEMLEQCHSTASQRLVEYFCVVTSVPRWQSPPKTKAAAAGGGGAAVATATTTPPPSAPSPPSNTTPRPTPHCSAPSQKLGPATKELEATFTSSTRLSPPAAPEAGTQQPQQPQKQPSESRWTEREDSSGGGNIHMPQHGSEASAARHTFRPVLTARFPATDHADNPLNPMILHFCHPAGDLITATVQYRMPRVHHFVLTLGCGRKLYGTCLTVLEEYRDDANDEPRSVVVEASASPSEREGGVEVLKSATPTTTSDDGKEMDTVLYIPKVLCLLSTWPYLTAFREYLSQLYRLAVTTNVMTAPLERYILNVCCEIPAPPPGAYEIQVPILDSIIRFWAPPAKLPIAYTALPYHTLFECLDTEHVLSVWTALVLERKVLLISSQTSVLTVCAEILCSLLFPLRWSHLYAPLLPRMLCPMLDAPVPYLCGIVRDNWQYARQFVGQSRDETTLVVDLDRNTVERFCGGGDSSNCTAAELQQQPPDPSPPTRKLHKLQLALTTSVGELFWRARGLDDAYALEMHKKPHKRNFEALRIAAAANFSQWDEKLSTLDHAFNLAYTPESLHLDAAGASVEVQSRWDRVHEAFLRFFVAVFRDYRSYLIVPDETALGGGGNTSKIQPTFDRIRFVGSLKVDNVAFVSELCLTQQFHDFLDRRMYSPGEPDLVFFDQSIDAKLNRSKLKLKKVETPLLHAAKVHKDLTKLRAVLPNEDDLPFASSATKIHYVYSKWPEKFDESLFCAPRQIPQMISAEFDRQAILVSKLRANFVHDDFCNPEDNLIEFYRGDYDPSPEIASFTVFLFVYSSLVGQDWQRYSQKRREEDANKPPGVHDTAAVETRVAAETVVLETDAVDTLLQDSALVCCGACPESGVMALSSTLSFIGASAEDAYNTYFRMPADEYTSLSLRGDKNVSMPETDAGVEEFEEAREVAAAQLELAFETLATMSLRSLSVDSDAYISLMEACGRCGDSKRALKLVELMKKDGFVADSEIMSCFISAFAHTEVHRNDPGPAAAVDSNARAAEKAEVDAYSRFLTKGLDTAKEAKSWFRSPGGPSRAKSPELIDDGSDDGSDWSSGGSSAGSSGMADWASFQPPGEKKMRKKKKRKRHKRQGSSMSTTPVTEMISRHLGLGESLLDFVYPQLVIDTKSDSCPHCSNGLTESNVVDGWKPCAFQDYTTQCPECSHRFVPRFVVTCSAPDFEGSQGNQTPLYCEFLSPWVLRKEFQHILKSGGGGGIDKIIDPAWRGNTDIRATLFWNLVVCCRRYRLPYTFLLQGNFQNRLILPRMPHEM